jgi:hypothetical protein
MADWQPMTWAYIGGFFDGEGCVNCREAPVGGRGVRRQFRLNVYQNTRDVLDEIARFLSGEGIEARVVGHERPDRVAKGHAGSFMLDITGVVNVWKVLHSMYPYLRVKREEAVDVLLWIHSLMEAAEDGSLAGPGTARFTYAALKAVI